MDLAAGKAPRMTHKRRKEPGDKDETLKEKSGFMDKHATKMLVGW